MTNAGCFLKDLAGISEISFPVPWGEVRQIVDSILFANHDLSQMRKWDRERAIETIMQMTLEEIGLVLTDEQIVKLEDFFESNF